MALEVHDGSDRPTPKISTLTPDDQLISVEAIVVNYCDNFLKRGVARIAIITQVCAKRGIENSAYDFLLKQSRRALYIFSLVTASPATVLECALEHNQCGD